MKFIIATGGTGGHLFPAIRVARVLKAKDHDILFLGSFSRGRKQIEGSGFAFEELGAKGFVGVSIVKKIGSMFAMIRAVCKALRMMRVYKPNAVIGFGGYGSFAVGVSAVLLRCPMMIHEQNVVPGQANRILSRFVRRIAVSFEESLSSFDHKKSILTGCPCHVPREGLDRAAILKEFNLEASKVTILVSGGSQGSQRINEAFIEAAGSLKEKLDFQVVHLCGQKDYHELQNRYNELGIPFALFKFLDKMEEVYRIADLAISRAGAVTVSEIASFQLPAIFIPYPYAHGHQRKNAEVLCGRNAAMLIEEKGLTSLQLTEAIQTMLKNLDSRGEIKDIWISDASQKIAEEAVCLGRHS